MQDFKFKFIFCLCIIKLYVVTPRSLHINKLFQFAEPGWLLVYIALTSLLSFLICAYPRITCFWISFCWLNLSLCLCIWITCCNFSFSFVLTPIFPRNKHPNTLILTPRIKQRSRNKELKREVKLHYSRIHGYQFTEIVTENEMNNLSLSTTISLKDAH